jgi:hypothetical protein
MYDYYLGGTHNFPADRELASSLGPVLEDTIDAAFANRGFHGRSARWMAERGIRQFLDIGSGLPTQNNTHETVHRVAPDARVVYVDNDPMVAAYGNALLAGDGTTTVITADVRDPDGLLGHPELRRLIDFGQPVGLLMTAVVHFIPDDQDPWGLVARYVAMLAPGSFLGLSHATYEKLPERMVRAGVGAYQKTSEHLYLRSAAQIERFFDGLEMLTPYEGATPGLTYVGLWGAEDTEVADTDGSRIIYCAVGKLPERTGRRNAEDSPSGPGGTG